MDYLDEDEQTSADIQSLRYAGLIFTAIVPQ